MESPEAFHPPDDPHPLEELREEILGKLLRGVPQEHVEEELIRQGFTAAYAGELVGSVLAEIRRRRLRPEPPWAVDPGASPFADFAAPERTAAEKLRERREEERRWRRGWARFACWVVAASSLGAGGGVGMWLGPRAVLPVLGGAFLGAVVGLGGGVTLSCVSLGVMLVVTTSKVAGYGARLARRDPGGVLTVLVLFFGSGGIGAGATVGATRAAVWLTGAARAEGAWLAVAAIGVTSGIVLSMLFWIVLRKQQTGYRPTVRH